MKALRDAKSDNPWAGLAASTLPLRLGPGVTASEIQRARHLLNRSLRPGTGATYRSWASKYLRFCAEHGLRALPGATSTIYRFVVDLTRQVAGRSVGRYLSAVFSMHRDLGYPVLVRARDPFIERIIYGRVAEQGLEHPREVGATLPASAVWDMVQRGLTVPDLGVLRALTAVAVTYRAVLRSDSSVSTWVDGVRIDRVPPGDDLTCTPCGRPDRAARMVLCDRCDQGFHLGCVGLERIPAGEWMCPGCRQPGVYPVSPQPTRWLVVRLVRRKGKTHQGVVLTQRYDLQGCPDLADLVERYQQSADAAWAAAGDQAERRYFFELPGDGRRWNTNLRLTEWLQLALQHVGWRDTASFTSHSIRRGAASAATAAGVPRPLLEEWGGWARGSAALASRYLDPAVLASPAGRAFFFYQP